MRQYERVRSEKGEHFVYNDLKNVYTIIFVEQSGKDFKKYPDDYIHRGECTFDTGLELNMLQKYFYIPIDIFLSIMDNKIDKSTLSELEAWIYFIGSDKPEDMEKIIRAYPKFTKMYEEINIFRKDPKEAVGMFSEALRILDENTVKLMIEQQKEELQQVEAELAEKKTELAEKETELAEKETELAEKETELAETETKLAETEAELAREKEEKAKLEKELEEFRKFRK